MSFKTCSCKIAATKYLPNDSLSAVSSPENRSENVGDVKFFNSDKQLEYGSASDKHLTLTGIVVEVVAVVISGFVIWEMEARVKKGSGYILLLNEEF